MRLCFYMLLFVVSPVSLGADLIRFTEILNKLCQFVSSTRSSRTLTVNTTNLVRSAESGLLEYLFTDYNPNARPVINASQGVNLIYDIALKQLLKVNEREQIMTTNVWIRHYWNDPLLKWDKEKWNNIEVLAVDPSIIWKPDITLYNNAEREFQGFDEFGKTRISIYNNGLCVWLLPIILRSQCKMNLKYFPFDEQFCPLVFGSWAYDGGALNFSNRNPYGDLTAFSKSGEFYVGALKATRISTKYDCCPNPYYTIEYSVHLVRKAKFYLFNLIIPGVLIALLTCFSFLLPPLSGERTGLIITNFLSLSVYIMMVSDSVPPSSNIPLLVKFYTELISEIGIALILNCIIIPLAARNTPMPQLVRKIFLQKLAPLVCCQRPEDRINSTDKTEKEDLNAIINNTAAYNTSPINDNVTYMNGNVKDHAHAPNMNGHVYSNGKDNFALRERRTLGMGESSEIVNKLSEIHIIMNDEVESRRHNGDWEQLTLVLDRIFFALIVVTIVISVTLILNDAEKITL